MEVTDLQPLRLHVFETLTGNPVVRVPFTDVSWKESINSAGQLTMTLKWSREAGQLNLKDKLEPWKYTLAVLRGNTVVKAGMVVRPNWDAEKLSLSVTCVDMWGYLGHMLSLDSLMVNTSPSGWQDGEVLIDEDHPTDKWIVGVKSNPYDWAANWLTNPGKWMPGFPLDFPPRDGTGNAWGKWPGWEMIFMDEALHDTTDRDDGSEIRFDPYLTEAGLLRWNGRVGRPEIADTTWQWNALRPGQRAYVSSVDCDGSGMVNQAYAVGGRRGDKTIVARSTVTKPGMPLLQVADLSHSQEEDVSVLKAYTNELVARGSQSQDVIVLKVGAEYTVRVGDHADVTVNDPWLGDTTLNLKVVDVAGDTSEWLTLQCRRL